VSQMVARSGGWHLTGEKRDQGHFDAVVIAHNGKCANRLVGPTGVWPALQEQRHTFALRLFLSCAS